MDVGGWAKMEAGDQLGNPHHPSENWWELGPVTESQEIFGGISNKTYLLDISKPP